MPFSSGTFSLFAGSNPVVTGTTIASSWANNTLLDIASNGLSYCVLKDGTQTMTANLPMGGFRITGLGAGTATTDAARLSQVQSSTTLFAASASGTNTVTAVLTPAITAYATGQQFLLIPANTNTGAVTLNVNSVGAGAVQAGGAALVGGELIQNVASLVAVVTTTPVFEMSNFGPFRDTRPVVVGGTDATKKVALEVDGLTTGTTRTLTVPDSSGTLITTGNGVAQIGFAAYFSSANQTITAAGGLTIAHSLARVPSLIRVQLKCTDAGGNVGYAQNDVIEMSSNAPDVANSRGVSVWGDATNINVRFGSGAEVFSVMNKTTGAAETITASKWAAVFKAWA